MKQSRDSKPGLFECAAQLSTNWLGILSSFYILYMGCFR